MKRLSVVGCAPRPAPRPDGAHLRCACLRPSLASAGRLSVRDWLRHGCRCLSLLVFAALLLAGCVTRRDQVAVTRAQSYVVLVSQSPDVPRGLAELAVPIANELQQVRLDIGADKIDPATVPLTVEASQANAAGIEGDRGAREGAWDSLLALLGLGGTAGAAVGLLIKALRSGRALTAAQGVIGGAVNLVQRVKEKAKDGLTAADVGQILREAQAAGPQFIEGARELSAEYQKVKALLAARAGEDALLKEAASLKTPKA